jgi:hypothetical protein
MTSPSSYPACVVADPLCLGSPDLLRCIKWASDGVCDRPIKKRASSDTEAEEAVVRFCGEVAAVEDYWLYPCAGGNGPGAFKILFTKARANGRIRPDCEVLQGMWKVIEVEARALVEMKKTPGFVTNIRLLDLVAVRVRRSI